MDPEPLFTTISGRASSSSLRRLIKRESHTALIAPTHIHGVERANQLQQRNLMESLKRRHLQKYGLDQLTEN